MMQFMPANHSITKVLSPNFYSWKNVEYNQTIILYKFCRTEILQS